MKLKPGVIFVAIALFPAAEIFSLFQLAHYIGGWAFLYVAGGVLTGMALIAGERVAMLPRLLNSVQAGASPLSALFKSGRYILAGMLFILPGVVSDVIALGLLLWPKRRSLTNIKAANDDIIEGEFTEEQPPPIDRLPR